MRERQRTEDVIRHHVEAILARDTDEILKDYTDQSTVYTPDGPVQGLQTLRCVFTGFFDLVPPEVLRRFEVVRQDSIDDAAYILWRAGDDIPLGTDTYVIRDNKIVLQSFAAYLKFREAE